MFNMNPAYYDLAAVKPNARFWIFYNGDWVKLTLQPSQTIDFSRYAVTDEGWESSYESYGYDETAMTVNHNCQSSGKDCDGRMDHEQDWYCTIPELTVVHDEVGCWDIETFGPPRPLRPNWQLESQRQRDHSAEAANY